MSTTVGNWIQYVPKALNEMDSSRNKCNIEPPLTTCLGNTPSTNLNVVNPFEINELLVMPRHSFMFIFLSFLLNANLYLLSRELYNYIKSQITNKDLHTSCLYDMMLKLLEVKYISLLIYTLQCFCISNILNIL